MFGVPDSPPPPQSTATADGNTPNPTSSSAGNGDASGLSPPAAPPAPAPAPAAPAPAGRSRGSSPARPSQPGGGSGMYDLFLTAVGLTPRGPAADTFSAGQIEEEEFWSAREEGGEGIAGDGADDAEYGSSTVPAGSQQPTAAGGGAAADATATAGLGAGAGEGNLPEIQQFPSTATGEIVHRTSGGTTGAGVSMPAALAGVHGRPGEGPTSRARQQLLSDTDVGMRYPGGPPESDGQAVSASLEATAAVAGTARRRRRPFGGNTPAAGGAAESESRTPGSRASSAAAATTGSRMFNSRGNTLFRSGDRGSFGSFWRPNAVNGSATFDDEDNEQDYAARAGTRAVERAINTASSVPTAAVADVEANAGGVGRSASRRGGSDSLDANDRREGGGGGDGSGTNGQGTILFYHKPTLANVPAGDIPDVVPVYLGCPRGNMALGLPLNEAWQGEEHQDTTFNQNLAYTILSWPEDHVQDLLELWRLQVLFFTTSIFNVLLSALLFFTENPDRTQVEGFARAGAFPGPFQQRSYADDPTGLRSEEWHLAAAFLLSVIGMVCVLARLRAGIALYLVLTVVNAVVGLGHSPDPLFACRYAVDAILVAMGRTFLSSLTYTWVTASAGDGRRGL